MKKEEENKRDYEKYDIFIEAYLNERRQERDLV
jgi:hypothetical protein